MKKSILLFIISVMLVGAVRGQQAADTTIVYYRLGRSDIDLSLRNNKATLDGFINRLNAATKDTAQRLVSLRLDAYSSPDGVTVANKRLSENRAKRLAEYIRSHIEFPESLLIVHSHGIDWEGLEAMVETMDIPYKEEVLDVLRNTPEWIFDDQDRVIDGRKRQLGMLRGGVPYNYLLDNVFPLLRRSCITLSYTVERAEEPQPQRPAEEATAERPADKEEQVRPEPAVQQEAEPVVLPSGGKREFRPLLAVKTNLLYWAGVMPDFRHYTFVPNLEIEYFFKERWSLSATGNYMKRSYGSGDFFGISSWSVEPRWWFKGDGRFRWFYLGAYGQVGDYDAQNSRTALDGTTGKLWGAGLSVGAAIPFADRWGLEVGIRGGYRHAGTKEYIHEAPDYFLERKGTDNHWGVTGIKASLYYRFGKGNKK
mgnify:CR=1 FL=1